MSGRNPDLPILDELGAEFEALASATFAADDPEPEPLRAAPRPSTTEHAPRRRAPLPAPRRSRERGAQARRIGRRAAVVLVLLLLVGGVALAALRGGDSDGHGHTSPTLLGRDDAGAWTLSAYRDEGKLCTVFVPKGGELSGNCGAAPVAGRLRAGSAVAAGHRYVFGLAGPNVKTASISLLAPGRRSGTTAIRRPLDPDATKDAGLPTADGWFVLDLGPVARHKDAAAPALVVPRTNDNHRTGPPYVDCSLGVLNPACERRIESAARG